MSFQDGHSRAGSGNLHRNDAKTDGGLTFEEQWAKISLHGAKCVQCGADAACRVQRFMEADYFVRCFPEKAALLMLATGSLPVVPMGEKKDPFIRAGEVHACKSCRPAVERAVARLAKSHDIVTIDEAPRDATVIQV